MIYLEVNFSMFCDQFHRAGRESQFSYEAKKALYEYLDEMYPNEDLNESWELDVISLCHDWFEVGEEDIMKNYDYSGLTFPEVMEHLRDNTVVLETSSGTYLIKVF